MTEWRKVKLGDLCERVTSGGTPKANVDSFYNPPTIPWLKTKEVNYCRIRETENFISEDGLNNSSAKIIAPNSIIIAMYGQGDTAGRVAINKIPLTTNQACCNLTLDRAKSDYEFVYYQLCTLYDKMVSLKSGAAQPNLNAQIIKNLIVEIPPLPIQHRIAEVLSRYDALIENYQRQIKLLEEAAQRLYKEWFVDLRFPGHQSTPIINNLPQAWQKKRITDILDIKYGKDHKKLKDGPIPVYGTGGIMRYADSCLYCGESVLIPRKGSLNNIMLVNGSFWTIDTMFYSIPKIENAAKIAYFYLKDLDMYSFNIGAAVPSMTINILSGMEISLPTDEIRHEFECTVDNYYQQIALLENQIRNLSEARDRLLPKLMNAEIEV